MHVHFKISSTNSHAVPLQTCFSTRTILSPCSGPPVAQPHSNGLSAYARMRLGGKAGRAAEVIDKLEHDPDLVGLVRRLFDNKRAANWRRTGSKSVSGLPNGVGEKLSLAPC